MRPSPLPPVLRSWQHLRETVSGLKAPEVLPIEQEGTTYTMAQELAWVDLEHFAVGRWDGSLSVFNFSESSTHGPLIAKAVNTPSSEGVQMITWLAPGVFVTSNDEQSAIVWTSPSGQWNDLVRLQILSFDSSLGVANSGTSYLTPDGSTIYLLIGHAEGYVTIWQGGPGASAFSFVKTVDVRSAHPVNPWGFHNIRGLDMIWWNNQSGYAVSGSEDGDLCVIQIPEGTILSRTVYNPQAQRGINSISTLGQNLLVANCSVGPDDKNLWYYWIDSNSSIQLRDSAKLQVDPSLAQVFNFDVIWGYYAGGICWLSATEEGYLWMGTISGNQSLSIIGNQQVTAKLGAALGMSINGDLALAAYDLYEFNTTPGERPHIGLHPARFSPPN